MSDQQGTNTLAATQNLSRFEAILVETIIERLASGQHLELEQHAIASPRLSIEMDALNKMMSNPW
jgi:hypothetical protein